MDFFKLVPNGMKTPAVLNYTSELSACYYLLYAKVYTSNKKLKNPTFTRTYRHVTEHISVDPSALMQSFLITVCC